jgi:hypothetical protein
MRAASVPGGYHGVHDGRGYGKAGVVGHAAGDAASADPPRTCCRGVWDEDTDTTLHSEAAECSTPPLRTPYPAHRRTARSTQTPILAFVGRGKLGALVGMLNAMRAFISRDFVFGARDGGLRVARVRGGPARCKDLGATRGCARNASLPHSLNPVALPYRPLLYLAFGLSFRIPRSALDTERVSTLLVL